MSLNVFSPKAAQATISVSFSERALHKAEQEIAKHQAKALRLTAVLAGCSGFRYDMSFVDAPAKGDVSLTISDTLTLFVEKKSVSMVDGTKIDVIQKDNVAEYAFDNPNSVGSCDCGENISVN